MRFVIQKINGEIVHDFAFTLIQCKPYYEWLKLMYGKDAGMTIKYANNNDLPESVIKNPDKYIPIGSVEFVTEYLKRFYPNAKEGLRPLNVPEVLFPFAGRKIANVYTSDEYPLMDGMKDIYAKSVDIIKYEFNGPYYDVPTKYQRKDFQHMQVSELIDIQSEWRVFVFHDKIQHVANYGGDCMVFPDRERIQQMVRTYKGEAPVAYTLDVAVTEARETVVIECHRFFSCGLYGYNDNNIYPKMLSQAWFEIKHLDDKRNG